MSGTRQFENRFRQKIEDLQHWGSDDIVIKSLSIEQDVDDCCARGEAVIEVFGIYSETLALVPDEVGDDVGSTVAIDRYEFWLHLYMESKKAKPTSDSTETATEIAVSRDIKELAIEMLESTEPVTITHEGADYELTGRQARCAGIGMRIAILAIEAQSRPTERTS